MPHRRRIQSRIDPAEQHRQIGRDDIGHALAVRRGELHPCRLPGLDLLWRRLHVGLHHIHAALVRNSARRVAVAGEEVTIGLMSADPSQKPDQRPHPYRRVVLLISVGLTLVYGASYFCPAFRVLYDKYVYFLPDWLRPFALAAVGFAFGNALAILVAPKSFLQHGTGRPWLLSGDSGELWIDRAWNRGKCLVLVLLFGGLTVELIRLAFID